MRGAACNTTEARTPERDAGLSRDTKNLLPAEELPVDQRLLERPDGVRAELPIDRVPLVPLAPEPLLERAGRVRAPPAVYRVTALPLGAQEPLERHDRVPPEGAIHRVRPVAPVAEDVLERALRVEAEVAVHRDREVRVRHPLRLARCRLGRLGWRVDALAVVVLGPAARGHAPRPGEVSDPHLPDRPAGADARADAVAAADGECHVAEAVVAVGGVEFPEDRHASGGVVDVPVAVLRAVPGDRRGGVAGGEAEALPHELLTPSAVVPVTDHPGRMRDALAHGPHDASSSFLRVRFTGASVLASGSGAASDSSPSVPSSPTSSCCSTSWSNCSISSRSRAGPSGVKSSGLAGCSMGTAFSLTSTSPSVMVLSSVLSSSFMSLLSRGAETYDVMIRLSAGGSPAR